MMKISFKNTHKEEMWLNFGKFIYEFQTDAGIRGKYNKHSHVNRNVLSAHPELDQVEGVLRALAEQVLEASLLLGELVVDLSDVHTLEQGVAVARVALADVHKQVLVVLRGNKKLNQTRLEALTNSRKHRTAPSAGTHTFTTTVGLVTASVNDLIRSKEELMPHQVKQRKAFNGIQHI